MTLTVMPTLLTIADSNYDIAIILDSSEEEEKSGKESLKDLEVKIIPATDGQDFLSGKDRSKQLDFYSNKYISEFGELISPPPEQSIL